jgi:hypothetical protein
MPTLPATSSRAHSVPKGDVFWSKRMTSLTSTPAARAISAVVGCHW